MADRFPSLDELDSETAAVTSSTVLDGNSHNELSFLEREKAVLPEGSFADMKDLEYDPDQSKFEQDFPDIMSPGPNTSVGGTIVDNVGPYVPGGSASGHPSGGPSLATHNAATQGYDDFDDGPEPEIIKEWRRRRDEAIAHRDGISEEKKAKQMEAAKQAIDDFYTNYNTTKERNIKKTRAEQEKYLANREDTTSGGTSWDRIAKLVDLSGHGAQGGGSESGKARFRELLKSLTKDPDAPGAAGV